MLQMYDRLPATAATICVVVAVLMLTAAILSQATGYDAPFVPMVVSVG
jgi:hypothetical protein